MLNRTIPPSFMAPGEFTLPELGTRYLDNGLTLHLIPVSGTEAVRIEFLFDAGSWYQQVKLSASMTSSMLNEGTISRSEQEIASLLDFYGAFIDLGINPDHSWIVLYSMVRHLPHTLEIISDILHHSHFPEKNFSTLLDRKRETFYLENQKVKNLARKKFAQVVFGPDHPYGAAAEERDFERITRQDVSGFFHAHFHPRKCRVYVSGAIEKGFLSLFSSYFGTSSWNKASVPDRPLFAPSPQELKKHFVLKDESVQSAIRLGRCIVNRDHPDFTGLQVLNTLLGGYFGSRLMKNLREEKGYTYGVGSALVSFRESGVLVIVCETGTEYTFLALQEIYNELERLMKEPVPEDELKLVKNYMTGDLMRSADGPFQIADAWKTVMEFELGKDYYSRLIQEITHVDALRLQELAETYLGPESLTEVVAGNHT
jgi:zinc protease